MERPFRPSRHQRQEGEAAKRALEARYGLGLRLTQVAPVGHRVGPQRPVLYIFTFGASPIALLHYSGKPIDERKAVKCLKHDLFMTGHLGGVASRDELKEVSTEGCFHMRELGEKL